MAWIRACGGGSPAVPDGRTVTPINDVTIWQQCAGIANPTYTTLAEILADVGVMSVLMASNNAVDYLVRCKDWTGKALVPTMTSNTTPSGEAIGSSKVTGTDYFMVFDGDDSTAWQCNASENNPAYSWVGYTFTSSKEVYRAKGIGKPGVISTEKIQGSNDGFINDIHDLSNYVEIDKSPNNNFDIPFSSVGKYTSYRMYGRSNAGGTGNEAITLQFYGVNICDNQYAMTYIGQNNYASNVLLSDEDWCNAICKSTYFASVLNVSVPTMTSNTTPSGECFADVVNADAYKAFDKNINVFWQGEYKLGYTFENSVKVVMIELTNRNASGNINSVKNFKLVGSNDRATFDDLASWVNTDNTQAGKTRYIKQIPLSVAYTSYAIDITPPSNGGTTDAYVSELQFYGRKDV